MKTDLRWYLTINKDGRHVQDATINEDNYICNVESTDKDALLIVSAPELLEACKELLTYINGDNELKTIMYPQSIDFAQQAIAKAEGRDND